MMTATVPHGLGDDARELRRAVAAVWSKSLAGKAWTRYREKLGINFVRALEVTHGKAGWHPHLHVLVFMDQPCEEVDAFGYWLFDRWRRYAEALGLGKCSPDAWRFERAHHSDDAGDYVAKGLGADWELTHTHLKQAKGGGRAPFQILADALATGNTRDIALFQTYAAAFKGARQLTWSNGLKDRYDVDQASDEELAALQDAEAVPVAVITNRAYEAAAKADALPDILDAAERAGYAGVWAVFARLGIRWGVSFPESGPPLPPQYIQ